MFLRDAMTGQPALSFSNVSVVRGGRPIWTDGSFEVPAGGITAVIGPNGSGKTTLLQIVLGLIRPATGQVRVFGRPAGEANRDIGYVPQNYGVALGEAVRVRDAVMLGLNGSRWGFHTPSRSDNEKVDEALAAVDASALTDKRLSQLSGGQRQRVALAEAIVGSPSLLILDEPLASLDLRTQSEIVALLRRINSEFGMTILVVAHDLNPLLGVITSAIYLVDGHAHFDTLDGVVDGELLSHLYGTRMEVVHTPQGDLFMRRP